MTFIFVKITRLKTNNLINIIIMQMTLKSRGYESPKMDIILIQPEAVLCQSGGYTTTLEGMSENDYTFTF